jgi:hypothetical protein
MSTFDVVTENGASGSEEAPAGSALAHVRAAAARQREARTLDLPVGGAFGGRLVLRYGTLPLRELERYGELGDSLTNLSLALDMMVSACRTVLWREDGIDTDLGVRIEPALWQLMDWPLPPGLDLADLTAREIVDALFGSNAMAVGSHLGELVAWMQEPGVPVPGESSGATS